MPHDQTPNLGFRFIAAAKEILPPDMFQRVSAAALEAYNADLEAYSEEDKNVRRTPAGSKRARSPEEYAVFCAAKRSAIHL